MIHDSSSFRIDPSIYGNSLGDEVCPEMGKNYTRVLNLCPFFAGSRDDETSGGL